MIRHFASVRLSTTKWQKRDGQGGPACQPLTSAPARAFFFNSRIPDINGRKRHRGYQTIHIMLKQKGKCALRREGTPPWGRVGRNVHTFGGGGPRHRSISFPLVVQRGPPTRDAAMAGCADSGSATRPTTRGHRLIPFARQSPDKAIRCKLGLCGRVVAAIAARAVALFPSAHMIVGEMMTPDAWSQHGSVA